MALLTFGQANEEPIEIPLNAKKFPLNRLPYSLKAQIFAKVHHEKPFPFLRTSRELRYHLLYHGPFPERIESMKLFGYVGKMSATGQFHVDGLTICIGTGDHALHLTVEYDRKREKRLLQRIRHVKRLYVQIEELLMIHSAMRVLDFLPEFRSVNEFTLMASNFQIIAPILASISGKIETRFSICLTRILDDVGTCADQGFCDFITKHLADCHVIDLQYVGRLFIEASVYAAIQTTNVSVVMLTITKSEEFWKTVHQVLKNGMISRNLHSQLKIHGTRFMRKSRDIEAEYTFAIDQFLQRFTERIHDPSRQARILEKFWKDKVEKLLPTEWEPSVRCQEISYFRRDLEEGNARLFYVFIRSNDHMYFYATLETDFE